MRIAQTIEIAAPPQRVFYRLGDPERARTWMPSVSETEMLSETPERVGSTFRERVAEGERHTDLHGVITRWVDDELIAFHLQGDYNVADVQYRLEPTDAHTRLHMTVTTHFKGLTRLVMFLLGHRFRRKIEAQLHQELRQLKTICEQES